MFGGSELWQYFGVLKVTRPTQLFGRSLSYEVRLGSDASTQQLYLKEMSHLSGGWAGHITAKVVVRNRA